jgi:hypothetical protein
MFHMFRISSFHQYSLFASSGVQLILSCVFILFVFVLSMLAVSLDCTFLMVPSLSSNVYYAHYIMAKTS